VAACSDAASALLSCSSQSRTFGSASNVISCWIFSGVASLFADAAGFPALAVAAKAPDNGPTAKTSTEKPIAATYLAAPTIDLP